MGHFYEPTPNSTDAYHKDGTGHEYYGKAPAGRDTNRPVWQIFKMEYSGVNWIIKWPVDTVTGVASDQPKFVWDNVETYTYKVLGT